MGKRMKLMPDYGCSPLWEYLDGDLVDNPSPDGLPLTDDLKAALHAWAAAYDRTLNQEYPPDSGFASPAEEETFEAEGRRLWRELRSQLGPGWEVVYHGEPDQPRDSDTPAGGGSRGAVRGEPAGKPIIQREPRGG
jgi:hypothetical protein